MLTAILAEAWRAMGANKLRSFLTMLGMMIGVAAVILMLAIGQGAQYLVRQAIATMGSNLFIVLSGTSTVAGVRSGSGNAPTLTLNDARAIADLSTVAEVAPMQPGNAQMIYGANNWNTQIFGVTPGYMNVRDWPLAAGDPVTDVDVRNAARVAVLGQTVAERLFGDDDPVGKTMRINSRILTVIGISPEGFTGTTALFAPEFFIPFSLYDVMTNDFDGPKRLLAARNNHALILVGRLKPGANEKSADAQLTTVAAGLANAYPGENKDQSPDWRCKLEHDWGLPWPSLARS